MLLAAEDLGPQSWLRRLGGLLERAAAGVISPDPPAVRYSQKRAAQNAGKETRITKSHRVDPAMVWNTEAERPDTRKVSKSTPRSFCSHPPCKPTDLVLHVGHRFFVLWIPRGGAGALNSG